MLQLFHYPFKVWITSVLGGSGLFILWIKYFEASNHTVLDGIYLFTYIITVICSGLLSVPAFILLRFSYWFLVNRSIATLASKFALIILSLILTFITTRMVPGVDEIEFWSLDNFEMLLCYWAVLIVGIVTYQFQDNLMKLKRNFGQ
jgi:hypothetical protein